MKLGEIKIEALYMCFANPDLVTDYEDTESLVETLYQLKSDPNLSDYLNASVGAVNRCLAYFEIKGLSPIGSVTVRHGRFNEENGLLKFKLSELSSNILRVKQIFSVDSTGNILPVGYLEEKDGTVLAESHGKDFTVEYWEKIPKISHSTADSYEIMLPDCLCRLIPYFVKGDILRVDDPDEARKSARIFKELCEGLVKDDCALPQSVSSLYKMG